MRQAFSYLADSALVIHLVCAGPAGLVDSKDGKDVLLVDATAIANPLCSSSISFSYGSKDSCLDPFTLACSLMPRNAEPLCAIDAGL